MEYYTVFAGVNGAGKSTLYRTYNDMHSDARVNCDEILREFDGDWKSDADQYKSGKIALERIGDYFNRGISFSQETTLSSRVAIKYAMYAKELGYCTELHFVYVESVDIAIERIRKRVRDGGHGIPDETVARRYIKSLKNLPEAIKVFNNVFVYDNTYFAKEIAVFHNGEMLLAVDDIPNWFKEVLDKINNQNDITP